MNRRPRPDAGGVIGIVGVAAPVLALFILPIWAFPGTQDSGHELLTWTVQHQGRLQIVMALNTSGVTLWLAFGAIVRTRLRTALPATSALPDLFGAGMVATVSLLLAGFTAFDVLVYRAVELSGADARMLYDVTFGLLAMSGMPTAVALTAFAVAVKRHRVAGTGLGWLAGVTAAAHVALLASLVIPRGVLSLEEWPITVVPALLFSWILATGIVLAHDRTSPLGVG